MRTVVLFTLIIILIVILIPLLLFCFLTRLSQPIIFLGKIALRLGQKILGISLDVRGVEKIDKKSSYVFMANHLSFMDGPLLFMIIPQSVRVLLKKEAFRIPILGLAMRQIGFIPVDRKGLKGGRKSIEKAAYLIKEKGYSFLIFPEGTRSRNGLLQPFKRGGFFIAVNTQAPIFPVSIKGTYELMPPKSFFVKRGKVKVTFHEPVQVRGYDRNNLPELIDEVRSFIQTGLA